MVSVYSPEAPPIQTPLHAEIERRMGLVPNFFQLAPEAPEISTNLWAFAQFGYLDNLLPSVFKERLFVYLSRFCEVRYCITRHAAFLLGLGRPAGDPGVPPHTVEAVVRLVRRPLARGEQLDPHVARCHRLRAPLAAGPVADTKMEEAVFACATHVFLQTPDAPRCLDALRRAFDAQRLQHLTVFLAFVRMAHYWTRVHPELTFECDLEELLATHEALADCLLNDPEASASREVTQRLLAELSVLRQDKQRHEELARAHALLRRERKQSEDLLVAQNRALELVAADAPLGDVLSWLASTVERQSGDQAMVMIMLVDAAGRRLRVGAAPSMPRELRDAMDGIAIEGGGATCSIAATINDVVITADLAAAASWTRLSHLPLGLGLCACWCTPIRGSDGRVLGTFGTYFRERRAPTGRERSIVEGLCRAAGLAIERRRAEQERELLLTRERAARAEAERASQMKDEFLATLSHELRTPLNAILGWSRILAGGASTADALARGLGVIERNARAQTRIIEDLLDMSGIISGKMQLELQPIDLAAVLEAAIETTRPAAGAKGVHVEVALDPSVPPLRGDPSRLQQVFWNLISNAVKFTPKGGRVRVRLEHAGAQLEVRVVDTGEGIAPEFLPFVFERFRQADASITRRHGGLGLGLAIVKQLVELHGGSVDVESRGVGHGSTFLVSLPLAGIHPDQARTGMR